MNDAPELSVSRDMAPRRRNRIYILVAAVLLMIAAVRPVASFLMWHGFMGRAGKQSLAAVDRKLKLVKVHMTREEVRAIMGDPVAVYQLTDSNEEVWVFARPYGASEYPRCKFSGASGRVVRVVPFE